MTGRDWSGVRVAIAGMGVSGEAVAHAVKLYGGKPTVFDQKPADTPSVMNVVDRLQSQDIEAVPGWHGHLDPEQFDYLVVSPGFPRQHPAIRDMVGKPILSEVEFASRIAVAPILAITGTNGKSTTTVMLWSMINGAGKTAYLCGNIAGSGYHEITLTEAATKAGPGDFLVAEISSYQLEFVSSFAPRVSAITNVTPDHMDRHPDFSDYLATKLHIFDRVSGSDRVVMNIDEPSLPFSLITGCVQDSSKIITFSSLGTPGTNGVTSRDGNTLHLSEFELDIPSLPLLTPHNVTNAMMAWEMAACVVTPNEGMLQALKDFKGLANRMEDLGEKHGVRVYNNSMCTNPAAVIASSKAVPTRQHILMGGNLKNLDFTPVGEHLAQTDHVVYLFGPDPATLRRMIGQEAAHYRSMGEAFEAAAATAGPGETILLAPGCASADPYVNFRERGDAFKEMVRSWMSQ